MIVGQLAISKAGHDKGVLYVITAWKDGFVYLSDGRLRAPDRPKKKRTKHIQLIAYRIDKNLTERLRKGYKVYPEEIRYALKLYLEKIGKQEEQEEQGAGSGAGGQEETQGFSSRAGEREETQGFSSRAGEQEEQGFSCGRQRY